MEFETILYEVADGVATLTLNRPDRYNAITEKMGEELGQAWSEVKRDPNVVCVIVTGAGDKALCTGMDVADVANVVGDADVADVVAVMDAVAVVDDVDVVDAVDLVVVADVVGVGRRGRPSWTSWTSWPSRTCTPCPWRCRLP